MSEHHDHTDDVDPYGMTCAELVELVTDYLDGALPASERARIDAHLVVCPPCVDVIEQWRTVIRLAGRLEEEHADRLPADDRALLMAAFRDASRGR
jgi:anti-sigma factor RsiW